MFCTNCGKEIDSNADVCIHCGVKQGKINHYCRSCGKEVNENAEICTNCGVKIKHVSFDDPLGGFSGGTRQKLTAALLCFFLGMLGIHDFYLGYRKNGFIKLICSITGIGIILTEIWAIIDLVQIVTGNKKDIDGNALI